MKCGKCKKNLPQRLLSPICIDGKYTPPICVDKSEIHRIKNNKRWRYYESENRI